MAGIFQSFSIFGHTFYIICSCMHNLPMGAVQQHFILKKFTRLVCKFSSYVKSYYT